MKLKSAHPMILAISVSSVLGLALAHSAMSASIPSNPSEKFQATGSPSSSTPSISDGTPIDLSKFNASITPSKGWEIKQDTLGMSLVLQAPKDPKVRYGTTTYQPNITLVAQDEGTPIDEIEAGFLKSSLAEAITKGANVSDVTVDDNHQFVDYKSEKDGLVLYSTFKMGDADLAQVHFVVSNEDHRFILTYTDLASELQKDDVFNKAWSMLSSITIEGEAPKRFDFLLWAGAGAGLIVIMLIGLQIWQRVISAKNFKQIQGQSQEASEPSHMIPPPPLNLNRGDKPSIPSHDDHLYVSYSDLDPLTGSDPFAL